MENINLFVQHHYFNKVVKLSLTQKKPQKLAQNAINYYYFKIYFWKIPTVMSCSEDKQFIYLFNLSAHASCKILSKGLQGDLEPFPDDVYNFSLLKLTNVKGSCYRQHLVTCNPRKKITIHNHYSLGSHAEPNTHVHCGPWRKNISICTTSCLVRKKENKTIYLRITQVEQMFWQLKGIIMIPNDNDPLDQKG